MLRRHLRQHLGHLKIEISEWVKPNIDQSMDSGTHEHFVRLTIGQLHALHEKSVRTLRLRVHRCFVKLEYSSNRFISIGPIAGLGIGTRQPLHCSPV